MRGVYLMAVSNKLGGLLLTTGNKSEMAVGYATIYGDMNGGFNPIKDMLKMRVYELADWRNKHRPADCLGPDGRSHHPEHHRQGALGRAAPRPEATRISLPPYPILDEILHGLVELELSRRRSRGRAAEAASTARWSSASKSCSTSPNTSAASRPRREDHPQGLRPRPPLPPSPTAIATRSRWWSRRTGWTARASNERCLSATPRLPPVACTWAMPARR